jgi:hypothetical protein
MKNTAIFLAIMVLILTACVPAKQQSLAQNLVENDLIISPQSMSIGIAQGFQNILVTYRNPGISFQKLVEPYLIQCSDNAGSPVSFITISSKQRDIPGNTTEVYQLTVSSTKEAKYGTYSCAMGMKINGQTQQSPAAGFTVEIRQ